MKRVILFFVSFYITQLSFAQTVWKPAAFTLATRCSKEVSLTSALIEYPRQQMVRSEWINLNGLWEYAVIEKDDDRPTKFDGQILVPYPIESVLSGIKKIVQPTENLWNKRTVNVTL